MRRKESSAWSEIGYTVPDLPALNAEAARARQADKAEHQEKLAAHDALPATRAASKSWFSLMHAVANGELACTPSGKISGGDQ